MLLRTFSAALLAVALGASTVAAQDFGVMESAEIIQTGNFKFTGYPVFVFGQDGRDDDVGAVLRAGYGFSPRLDGELMLGLYEATHLGGNLELALLQSRAATGGVDVAARGGLHVVRGGVVDATGLDLALLLSSHLTPSLELVGAVDFNRRFNEGNVDDVNTLHLVPGVEFRLSRQLDLLGEVGIGLDDHASTYAAVGLAFYLR